MAITRQQIYDRIRATSREEVVLEEMVRMGFWKRDEKKPSPSELLIRRETEIRRELDVLLKEKQRYANKERLLIDMRKARMERAKQKRAETKARNEAKRQQKAADWAELQKRHIVYLGEGVSAGLNKTQSDSAALARFGLPVYHEANTLATAMGISLAELRFLSFHREVSNKTHYQRYYIPKKSGGQRMISAPMPRLKAAQHWVLNNILHKVPNSNAAHGFVPGRSVLTNAQPHVGQEIVLNVDLKDFFPTIEYKRVKGLFVKLGYAEQVATILALLCTEPEVDEAELDGKHYYIAKTARHLPQGAPTSPALTNIICYQLDKRFEGLAKKHGFNYTRYADDMTFSAGHNQAPLIGRLLRFVKQVVKEEGFVVHPEKIAVMRKGDQRRVTGIVVNEKPGLDRDILRRFRAFLHQATKSGLKDKKWGHGDIVSSIEGFANYVYMVKPEQGKAFKAQIAALLQRPDIRQQIAEMRAKNGPEKSGTTNGGNPFWQVI